jgi:hypothetical protein
MNDRVELVGEPGVEVMREALGLGPVDDTDRTLEPASVQSGRVDEGSVGSCFVEERLPASCEGGTNALALGGSAPVGSRSDGARTS